MAPIASAALFTVALPTNEDEIPVLKSRDFGPDLLTKRIAERYVGSAEGEEQPVHPYPESGTCASLSGLH